MTEPNITIGITTCKRCPFLKTTGYGPATCKAHHTQAGFERTVSYHYRHGSSRQGPRPKWCRLPILVVPLEDEKENK